MITSNSRLCDQDFTIKIIITCNSCNIENIMFVDFDQIITCCHCYCCEPDLTCNEKIKVKE